MKTAKIHALRTAVLLAAAAGPLWAADFIPPAEGPVAFRRDLVPLDTETMAGISQQLVILARGMDGESAASRRATAQMLALSTALDPGNSKARALIADLEAGHRPASDLSAITDNQARLWQTLEWLESPEAGPGGQALAACLGDVIRASDFRHPKAEALAGSPERGAWAGWIPVLSAYEKKLPVEIPGDRIQEESEASPILLAQAQVTVPLWRNLDTKWTLSPAPLQMTAEAVKTEGNERPKPFSIIIGASEEGGSLRKLVPAIQNVLTTRHGNLPLGVRVTIGGEALEAATLSKSCPAVSAAAAVLASAALSGIEPDATIVGIIDESGAFTLSTEFWDQLQALKEGRGGRLVLPAAAAEYLPSLLALEQSLFFLRYEVLLASNFQELLDRSAKVPGGTQAGASAKFMELRSKLGNQPIGSYVANRHIRRRLEEIAQETPYHFSARMLAIQGAGDRPVWVIRPVLVAETRRALDPLKWLVERDAKQPFAKAEVERLGSTMETCREQLDRITRYCGKEDRELLADAQNLMITLRTLDRTLRARNVDIWNFDAFRAFLREHKSVSSKLALAAGEVLPETRKRR